MPFCEFVRVLSIHDDANPQIRVPSSDNFLNIVHPSDKEALTGETLPMQEISCYKMRCFYDCSVTAFKPALNFHFSQTR